MASLKEAYSRLGYELQRQGQMRPFWSAEKADGICISLWKSELGDKNHLDTTKQSDISKCDPVFNLARVKHLKIAQTKFNGKLDVIILHGVPGNSKPVPDLRKWTLKSLNEVTGDFEVFTEAV